MLQHTSSYWTRDNYKEVHGSYPWLHRHGLALVSISVDYCVVGTSLTQNSSSGSAILSSWAAWTTFSQLQFTIDSNIALARATSPRNSWRSSERSRVILKSRTKMSTTFLLQDSAMIWGMVLSLMCLTITFSERLTPKQHGRTSMLQLHSLDTWFQSHRVILMSLSQSSWKRRTWI